MFKLANNGNVLLDVSKHAPPSAAFIIDALEKSTFCECKIDHEAIDNFFKAQNNEPTLVVASKHDAHTSSGSSTSSPADGPLREPGHLQRVHTSP